MMIRQSLENLLHYVNSGGYFPSDIEKIICAISTHVNNRKWNVIDEDTPKGIKLAFFHIKDEACFTGVWDGKRVWDKKNLTHGSANLVWSHLPTCDVYAPLPKEKNDD